MQTLQTATALLQPTSKNRSEPEQHKHNFLTAGADQSKLDSQCDQSTMRTENGQQSPMNIYSGIYREMLIIE